MTPEQLTAAERLADELDLLPTTRPRLVGDGIATIRALLAAYRAQQAVVEEAAAVNRRAYYRDLDRVLQAYRAQQKETTADSG